LWTVSTAKTCSAGSALLVTVAGSSRETSRPVKTALASAKNLSSS
jgi:hypothetical protein